jgi:hypothetical protein
MRTTSFVAVLLLVVAPAVSLGAGPDDKSSLRASLLTVEGTVQAVDRLSGEGELPVVAISLVRDTDAAEAVEILLAPEKALTDIGFEVEVGDRCRVRIFSADRGPAKAHKIFNISRGTMVRIRTLHQVPLWDGSGAWQGGRCRDGLGGGGQGGVRHRGGR